MGDAEDVLALAHGRAEGDVLLLGLPCLLPPGLSTANAAPWSSQRIIRPNMRRAERDSMSRETYHGGGGGDGDGGRGEWRSGGGGGDKTLAQGTAAGAIRLI